LDGLERRLKIMEILSASTLPVTGSELASKFGVSRQVIVQDIALIRASGQDILATPQGYILTHILAGAGAVTRTLAVKHSSNELEKELLIIVDNGGKVLDVVVEHPLYGELRGMLMLSSRRDVYDFMLNLYQTNAQPLSALTEGVHIHTVEAPEVMVLNNIEMELGKAGILLNK